jgi:hypothetical protein
VFPIMSPICLDGRPVEGRRAQAAALNRALIG